MRFALVILLIFQAGCCSAPKTPPVHFDGETDKGCWREGEEWRCSPGCSYDGCNTCCEIENGLRGCTAMYCTEEEP